MLLSLNQLPREVRWGLFFPVVFLNLWLLLLLVDYLEPLVGILVAASLLAFLLDYPIRFLQWLGVPRGWAIAGVLLLALFLLGGAGLLLGPQILSQANELVTQFPTWIESGQQQLQVLADWTIAQQWSIDLSGLVTQLGDRLSTVLRSLSSQLVSLILSTINSIVNIFLTLIFAIFLVVYGGRLWDGLYSWLPGDWGRQIRQIFRRNFQNYIAGQVTLASLYGILLTTAFVFLQVPLALLFGLGIGVLSLIPFGGSVGILGVSLLTMLQNFWLGVRVILVCTILGQINDNLIGPRLVGGITGLNPVWLLISLFLGVKIGGILGVLVAVPLAEVIKNLAETIRTGNFSRSAANLQPTPSLPQSADPSLDG